MSYDSTFYTGETAENVVLEDGDSLILSGGMAINTTMTGGIVKVLPEEGTAFNTVMSGGSLYASGENVLVESTTLEGGAMFTALAGVNVESTIVKDGGKVDTYAKTFDNAVVSSGGSLNVYEGMVNNLTVLDKGNVEIYGSEAVVNDLVISAPEEYTSVAVLGSATLNGATIGGSNVILDVYGSAVAKNVTVNSGGALAASAGASINNVEINAGGSMYMENEVNATGISVNSGGWFSAGFHWRGYYGDLSSIGAVVRENGGTVMIGSGDVETYYEDIGYVQSYNVPYPVTFLPNTFRDLVYSNYQYGTVHSGTTAVDITAIEGGLTVHSGGIVNGYTATPYTYDSAYERTIWDSSFNEETHQWEYFVTTVTGTESVTRVGNLTVLAGGIVTGLVAQAKEGSENGTYLNFQIAPGTVINGMVDGVTFATSDGELKDASLKDANLTYMSGAVASNVTQSYGDATFSGGVFASAMVFSGTNVTFSRGAVADGVKTAVVPTIEYEYLGGGLGADEDEEEQVIITEGTSGAYVNVLTGASVTSLDMDSKSFLHMQVAPTTILQGTSGGVTIDLHGGYFANASLGNTFVEVMGPTSYKDDTGVAVTIGAGTVSNLTVNMGALVSAYDGSTLLNMVENGGAVMLGWGNDISETITYSFTSNAFSYDQLEGQVTVHKNTSAVDNIMTNGELMVYSGGVVNNFYTVAKGMNYHHDVTLYDGAIVSNLDTVRYAEGAYHPGNISINGPVLIDGARLTDWDGIQLWVTNDTQISNASLDSIPFTVENGVLSGFHAAAVGSPYWDNLTIDAGAVLADSCLDTNGSVGFRSGAKGIGNTIAQVNATVERGAVLEKTTLGLPPIEAFDGRYSYTLDRGGSLFVEQGGVVRDIDVSSDSVITIEAGGKLTGKMRFEDGASVSVSDGSIIDFDITAPSALYEARTNTRQVFNSFYSNPKYTVTVSATQADGTYVLAENAFFSDNMYFFLVGDDGREYGYFEGSYDYPGTTVEVNADEGAPSIEKQYEFFYVPNAEETQPVYDLSMWMDKVESEDGMTRYDLCLTVTSKYTSSGWLAAPTVTADIATFTTSDVCLTVDFGAAAATREYSLDGQTWIAIPTVSGGDVTGGDVTGGDVTGGDVTPGGDVTGGDVTGGGDVTPGGDVTGGDVTGGDVTPGGDGTSGGDVTGGDVTGGGDDGTSGESDGVAGDDGTGGEGWTDITKANYGYELVGDDESEGNGTEHYENSGTLDDDTTGNGAATLGDNDNATFVTLITHENGTYYFRGTDADGVVSDVTSFRVSNIDKVAPTTPTGLNSWTTEDEDGTVTLTFGWAESTDDYSGIRKYIVQYWENGSQEVITVETPYTHFDLDFPASAAPADNPADNPDGTSVPVGEDGLIIPDPEVTEPVVTVKPSDWSWSVQAVDYAGNVSEAAVVDNSAKIAKPVAVADVTTPTSNDVYVTVTFDPEAAQNQFSWDGRTWETYTGDIQFAENDTVYLRSLDAEGNSSAITAFEVTNIDKIPPEAPVATASTTDPTNQDVIVTATFSEDSVQRRYGIVRDGYETWYDYTEDGVVVSENDTILFEAVDAAGNGSPITRFTVDNIDRVPPEAPVASVAAAEGFEGVLVSALFSEDSVTKEYSFDGKEWSPYQDAVPVREIGTTVFFRGTDAAGNPSAVTDFTVNSFAVGPAAPVAKADVTAPTNQNVTVTATFDPEAALNQFSWDGRTWETYTDDIQFDKNNTVYFRSLDDEGNSSAITTFVVANIDRVPPDAPLAYADINELTNKNVTVFATYSEDSVVRVYSLARDGYETWYDYTDEGVVLSSNDTIRFGAEDAAGNYSALTEFTVSNIDTTPPAAPIASVAAAETFEGVLVSARFSDDSITQEFSFDRNEWQPYQGSVQVTEIGTTVYFRGTDAAGNPSDVTEYKVESFVVGPDAPVASADISDPTNQDVTVTATFAEGAALNQFSMNGQDWETYAGGIVFDDNGVVFFRSLDADGRESSITTFIVDNIDRVAPNAPFAYANINDPTNQAVTVFARFSEDSVVRQYSYDGREDWTAYPEEGIVFSDNNYLYFRGIDAAGNISNLTAFEVTNIDKVPPTAPVVTVTAADLPAGQGLDVAAAFSDDSVTKEYSLDGKEWTIYQGAVQVTEIGTTVYFRGTDAAGNVSDVTPYEVTKLYIGPAAPTVSASVTELTNGDVMVFATFADGTVKKEYSLDGLIWSELEGEGIVFHENGTVYFRGADADGNYSTVTPYNVVNIDRVAPNAPLAAASATADTTEPVLVSATFSDDSAIRQYSLDGKEWMEYTDPIQFTKNGLVYFRGTDAAGNVSEITRYVVSNIYEIVEQKGDADDGWNNYVYNKKISAGVNPEAENFHANIIGYGAGELLLDRKHSLSVDNWSNFVGKDVAGVVDEIDFAKLTLDYNSKVNISVKASQKGTKFSICKLQEKTPGNYVFSTVASMTVNRKNTTANDETYYDSFTVLLPLLDKNGLENQYFISVECKSASKGTQVYYDVMFNEDKSYFYDRGDNSDDWTDLAEKGADSLMYNDEVGVLDDFFDVVGWVGYGDEIDYYRFTLDHAANLSFTIEGGDALTFTIYSLVQGKNGYSLKKLQSTSLKLGKDEDWGEINSNLLMLDADEYYFSVKSNNAAAGASVDYGIWLAPESVFYGDADNGWNNWVYDKKAEAPLNLNQDVVADDGKVELYGLGPADSIQVDKPNTVSEYFEVRNGNELVDGYYTNYVGIGDLADYVKIHLDYAASISFSIHASDALKFSIYTLVPAKGGKFTLKTLQTTSLNRIDKAAGEFQAKTKKLLLEDGDYYISLQATKKAQAFYNVFVYSNAEDAANSTVFFDHESKYNGADIPAKGKDGDVFFYDEPITETGIILSEADAWVGCGDPIDFGGFTVVSDVQLNFTVTATDAATFKLYTTGKDRKGNTILSVLQTTKLALNKKTGMYEAQTKPYVSMQGGGTFYYSVESPNAKKGGNAYYQVELDDRSVIAPAGSTDDNWTDKMTAGYDGKILDLGTITAAGDEPLLAGWVGLGDEIDYAKFTVASNTRITFRVVGTDEFLFHVGELTASGVLQDTFKYMKDKKSGKYTVTTKTITLEAGKTYYLDVNSFNYSKKKGLNVDYKVYVDSFVSSGNNGDALSAPESIASLDGWNTAAAGAQDDLLAGQSVDSFDDVSSAVANAMDDEAARRLGAELSFLA